MNFLLLWDIGGFAPQETKFLDLLQAFRYT